MTLCLPEDRGHNAFKHTFTADLNGANTQFSFLYLPSQTQSRKKKNILCSLQASAEDYLTSQRLVVQLLPPLSHTQTGFNHQIAGGPLLPLSVSPTLIPLHSAPSGLVG